MIKRLIGRIGVTAPEERTPPSSVSNENDEEAVMAQLTVNVQ